VVGVLADSFGMNAAFYSMGGLNLIAFLGVTLILPEVARRKATAVKLSFRAITASGITRGIFSYQTGVAAQRGIMMAFLPIFVSIFIGLSPSLTGTVLTAAIVLNSLMQIPAGQLADIYNRRHLVVLGCLGGMASMILIPQARSFGLLLTFMILGSTFDSLAMPPAMAMIVQEGRKYGMGTATSVSNMGMGFGMGLAPVLAGLAVDLSDVRMAFYIAAIATFIGMFFFNRFTRKIFDAEFEVDKESPDMT
jgi:MFS family permease